jgi:hypothetical protein
LYSIADVVILSQAAGIPLEILPQLGLGGVFLVGFVFVIKYTEEWVFKQYDKQRASDEKQHMASLAMLNTQMTLAAEIAKSLGQTASVHLTTTMEQRELLHDIQALRKEMRDDILEIRRHHTHHDPNS